MICGNCNRENPDNTNYCIYCGADLTQNSQPVNAYQSAQQQQYPNYGTPSYVEDEHISVAGWVGRLLIPWIPFVGGIVYLVMLFVWAFSDHNKKSLKNFAKAQLIILAIVIGLAIIAGIFMAIAGISFANSFSRIY